MVPRSSGAPARWRARGWGPPGSVGAATSLTARNKRLPPRRLCASVCFVGSSVCQADGAGQRGSSQTAQGMGDKQRPRGPGWVREARGRCCPCLIRWARRLADQAQRQPQPQPHADRLGLGQGSQSRKLAGPWRAGHHLPPPSFPSASDLSAESLRGSEMGLLASRSAEQLCTLHPLENEGLLLDFQPYFILSVVCT